MSEESRPSVDAAQRAAARRRERPLTQEEVLRRNSVERLKQEKHPYDVLENIPSGIRTRAQRRTVGRIGRQYGENTGELTTRQYVQIHWIRLESLPAIFQELAEVGLTTAGGCGDNLRNVTGCPVAGIDPEEIFDANPTIQEIARFFSGNREYGNLPRKHKYTVSACPYHCNVPEIHDIALVGTRQGGRDGYAFWVGGGLSSVPRSSEERRVGKECRSRWSPYH